MTQQDHLAQAIIINRNKQALVRLKNRDFRGRGEGYRLGVMGGTFNPVHYGHLAVADAVYWEMQLNSVMFVPSGRPPHKSENRIASGENRYQMLMLATADNPYFWVSSLEIERPGYSYTIDTVKEIKGLFGPLIEIYFIVGADALADLLSWKNADELLALCNIVVADRPGYALSKAWPKPLISEHEKKAKIVRVPSLAISSTDIRARLRQSRSIRYLLPETVRQHLQTRQLYVSG